MLISSSKNERTSICLIITFLFTLFFSYNGYAQLNWGYFLYTAKDASGNYVSQQVGSCSEDITTHKVNNSCPGYQDQGCTKLIKNLSPALNGGLGDIPTTYIATKDSIFPGSCTAEANQSYSFYTIEGGSAKKINLNKKVNGIGSICPDEIAVKLQNNNTPCWKDTSATPSIIRCACPLPSLRNELNIGTTKDNTRTIKMVNNCPYVVSPGWTSGALTKDRYIESAVFEEKNCESKRNRINTLLGKQIIPKCTQEGSQYHCDSLCYDFNKKQFINCSSIPNNITPPGGKPGEGGYYFDLPNIKNTNVPSWYTGKESWTLLKEKENLTATYTPTYGVANDACGFTPPMQLYNGNTFPRACMEDNSEPRTLKTTWEQGDGTTCKAPNQITELKTTDFALLNDDVDARVLPMMGPAIRFEYTFMSGTGDTAFDTYNSSMILGLNVPFKVETNAQYLAQEPISDFTCGIPGGYGPDIDPWKLNDNVKFGYNAWKYLGTLKDNTVGYTPVSIDQIISNPGTYQGLYINVTGNNSVDTSFYVKADDQQAYSNTKKDGTLMPIITLPALCDIGSKSPSITKATKTLCDAAQCEDIYKNPVFSDKYKCSGGKNAGQPYFGNCKQGSAAGSPSGQTTEEGGCTSFDIDYTHFIPQGICVAKSDGTGADLNAVKYCNEHNNISCFLGNTGWLNLMYNHDHNIDYLSPLQKISYTSYTYPYADKNATFTCPNINYAENIKQKTYSTNPNCATGLCPPYEDSPSGASTALTKDSSITYNYLIVTPHNKQPASTSPFPIAETQLLEASNNVNYTLTYCPTATTPPTDACKIAPGSFTLKADPSTLNPSGTTSIAVTATAAINSPTGKTCKITDSSISYSATPNFNPSSTTGKLGVTDFTAQSSSTESYIAGILTSITWNDGTKTAPREKYNLKFNPAPKSCAEATSINSFAVDAEPKTINSSHLTTTADITSLNITTPPELKCGTPTVEINYAINDAHFTPQSKTVSEQDKVPFTYTQTITQNSSATITAKVTRVYWAHDGSSVNKFPSPASTTVQIVKQGILASCNKTAYNSSVTITPAKTSIAVGEKLTINCTGQIENTQTTTCQQNSKKMYTTQAVGAPLGLNPLGVDCSAGSGIFTATTAGTYNLYGSMNVGWSDGTANSVFTKNPVPVTVTSQPSGKTLQFKLANNRRASAVNVFDLSPNLAYASCQLTIKDGTVLTKDYSAPWSFTVSPVRTQGCNNLIGGNVVCSTSDGGHYKGDITSSNCSYT